MSWIKNNWFKLGVITILLVVGGFSIYYLAAVRVLENSLALQTKCADDAAKAFASGGYKIADDYGNGSDYKDHYNSKLNKCFILISSYDIKSDLLTIDLYDALERKHYASYIGHSDCTLPLLGGDNNVKKCLLDSGSIWFDGDDTKNPPDYHVGFQGLAVGPGVGDENTQKQFLDIVKPLMSE